MADISNKTLGVLVGVALVVSLIGLFSIPGKLPLTGFGTTDTGEAKINITQLISINVTQKTIDFGTGTIDEGIPNCMVETSGTGSESPSDCWSGTTPSDGFHVENVGNAIVNVSIKSGVANAAAFWGVSGGGYAFKCSGNGTAASANWVALTSTEANCIYALSAAGGSDIFETDLNLTIPAAAVGYKNDTITFTAVASS